MLFDTQRYSISGEKPVAVWGIIIPLSATMWHHIRTDNIRCINNNMSRSSMLITQNQLLGCMRVQVMVKHPLWKPGTLGDRLCPPSGCSNSWSLWQMSTRAGLIGSLSNSNKINWLKSFSFLFSPPGSGPSFYRQAGFSWNSPRAITPLEIERGSHESFIWSREFPDEREKKRSSSCIWFGASSVSSHTPHSWMFLPFVFSSTRTCHTVNVSLPLQLQQVCISLRASCHLTAAWNKVE